MDEKVHVHHWGVGTNFGPIAKGTAVRICQCGHKEWYVGSYPYGHWSADYEIAKRTGIKVMGVL